MFLGSFTVKVREKNRIAFPAKFREQTGDTLFITNWFEKSLLILSKKDWEKIIEDILEEGSFLVSEVRDLERFIFGGTFEVELDKEGRFVLPPALKEHIGLQKEAIFIGGAWYISLWDLTHYESYREINNLQIKDRATSVYKRIKELKS